ncbi:MAG: phosphoribosylamine--glycine ligase [Bacteroidetes bacterium]|nr:phosphoribosylamine--glycine ligase [Bacteroidota bacterium]
MHILLLGSGGRENALAWKIAQSPLCKKLIIAPGNPGTAQFGTNIPVSLTNFEQIEQICMVEAINMVVVGPEDPLVNGISDYFNSSEKLKNIFIIGPRKYAAQLEGSKAFAKEFMLRHNIPTAAYKEFTSENFQQGIAYLKQHSLPIVLKADGLAAGKGVVICNTIDEALAEFEAMIQNAKFGEASKKVVVEEFLQGIEMSTFALTDGKNYVILPEAKDYKRIGVGDTGLNTGGMGAVSPVPFADAVLKKKIEEKIIKPTIAGFEKDKMEYVGFVFFGLMINDGEPYVIEYNCRMGDPETEVVMPRLKNDLVELLIATKNGRLNNIKIEVDERTACTIVAVSGGYPGDYKKGKEITGVAHALDSNSILFQMGTVLQNGQLLTNGGRVLCITSFGKDVAESTSMASMALQKISFQGMNFRNDIGYEFK